MHALRARTYSTLGSSLGSLVFNIDMFLKIPLIANWHAVTKQQEHFVSIWKWIIFIASLALHDFINLNYDLCAFSSLNSNLQHKLCLLLSKQAINTAIDLIE